MKKTLLSVLVILMTVCALSFNSYAYSVGDLNSDEYVNAEDALLILKHAAKLSILPENIVQYADIDWNESVDASDALWILKYAAKLIDKFPVEEIDPTETVDATATPENPNLYEVEENSGYLINKLPFNLDGISINSFTVDENGRATVNVINNTGKTVSSSSLIYFKCYDSENVEIKESWLFMKDCNDGQSCDIAFNIEEGTTKLVFYKSILSFRDTIVESEMEDYNGISVNRLPYTDENNFTINSIEFGEKNSFKIIVYNGTGKDTDLYSFIKYKCLNSEGTVVLDNRVNFPNMNKGESCELSLKKTDDTTEIIFYKTSVHDGEAIPDAETESYDGIEFNKLPAEFNGLVLEDLSYSEGKVYCMVSNNTGDAVDDSSTISYRCFDNNGVIIGDKKEVVYAMDAGEKCRMKLSVPEETAKIIVYNSKVVAGVPSGEIAVSDYNGILINPLPMNLSGIEFDSYKINQHIIAVNVTNKTGAAVNNKSGVNFKCYDSDDVIIYSGLMYFNNKEDGESFTIATGAKDGLVKLIFYNVEFN